MRHAIAVSTLCAALAIPAAAREVHKVVPLDGSGRVVVESHNGSVVVTTWAQPNVSVDARIEPADWGGDAEDVEKTKILVARSGNEVRVESDYTDVPTHTWLFGLGSSHVLPDVHYTIHVPATARLEVTVHNATVSVDGITAGAAIHAHNGSIRMTNLAGRVTADTHNGDIRLAYARFSEPAEIQTHNGECEVRLPADARATVTSETNHEQGAMTSDFPVTVRASESGATTAINGGGPAIRFTAHNGTLHIARR